MREMLAVTAAINGAGLGEHVALLTDGRFSGRDARLHGRPRRPRGGARRPDRRRPRRRRDHDRRRRAAASTSRSSDDEIAARVAAYSAPDNPDSRACSRSTRASSRAPPTARSRSSSAGAPRIARNPPAPAGGRVPARPGEHRRIVTIASTEAGAELTEPWRRALREFDDDLRIRAAAAKTRRAYGGDVDRFARWCVRHELPPAAVDVRSLRRYAASLSQAGLQPSSLARNVASLRSFYRMLREHGAVDAEPGRAADPAQAPALAAARAAPRGADDPARPHRGGDGARSARPRDARARLRVRPARRGARQADARLRRVRRRAGPGRGQGLQDPLRAGRRAGAARAERSTSSAPAPRSRTTTSARCCSRSRAGRSPPPTCAGGCGSGRCGPGWAARCIRTRCATPSRPTFSTAAPTCARSRSCSGIRAISTTQVYTQVESARLRRAYASSHPRA